MHRPRVLFLCTHNSARSQMAQGLLAFMAGDRFEVHSAGTVATGVSADAIEVMADLGIDISAHESKTLDRYRNEEFDWVVTVCDAAADACPAFPGRVQRLHWSLPDPGRGTEDAARRLQAFRCVRDRLRRLIEDFVRANPSA
jgi:arsenate reductase (thioredoxin)